MEQDINYCKNSAKIAQRFAASKTYTALMSLVIFARKDDKLKFSCRKFIIFWVQQIFSQATKLLFHTQKLPSSKMKINNDKTTLFKRLEISQQNYFSLKNRTFQLTFSMSDILVPLSVSLQRVAKGLCCCEAAAEEQQYLRLLHLVKNGTFWSQPSGKFLTFINLSHVATFWSQWPPSPDQQSL